MRIRVGDMKGKAVPVPKYLSTTSWRRMGSGCIDPHFLGLGTGWMWEVSFTIRGTAPVTHRTGGLVDLRAGLDAVEKRISWPYRDSNSSSAVQPVATRYTDWATPAPAICWGSKSKSRYGGWSVTRVPSGTHYQILVVAVGRNQWYKKGRASTGAKSEPMGAPVIGYVTVIKSLRRKRRALPTFRTHKN
jgi:hypothetical protein